MNRIDIVERLKSQTGYPPKTPRQRFRLFSTTVPAWPNMNGPGSQKFSSNATSSKSVLDPQETGLLEQVEFFGDPCPKGKRDRSQTLQTVLEGQRTDLPRNISQERPRLGPSLPVGTEAYGRIDPWKCVPDIPAHALRPKSQHRDGGVLQVLIPFEPGLEGTNEGGAELFEGRSIEASLKGLQFLGTEVRVLEVHGKTVKGPVIRCIPVGGKIAAFFTDPSIQRGPPQRENLKQQKKRPLSGEPPRNEVTGRRNRPAQKCTPKDVHDDNGDGPALEERQVGQIEGGIGDKTEEQPQKKRLGPCL